jgi:ATP-dependent Lhr-like helicase
MEPIEVFFQKQGWQPFDFQRKVWSAYLDGRSGLIHAPTGMGKTFAALMGPVAESLDDPPSAADETTPLTLVWITPLRALAADTESSVKHAVHEMGLPWTVQRRTSDTSSTIRAAQRKNLPTVLITTPESLTVLLSYPDAAERFSSLRSVVVDEWHELVGSKRGIQTELALARLRRWRPGLRVWGMSATIGNLREAATVLLPTHASASTSLIIEANDEKDIVIDTLWPQNIERFPWAGHLGLRMLPEILDELERVGSALVFTNTRAQTEEWYQAILQARPKWAGQIALHHGSLDRKQRAWVEQALADGRLRCVVCTSSLDLGVDFAPVERVFQVGSPKGVGRLMQRAGRSGHQPGSTSRATGVPANTFELLEFAAARRGVVERVIEPRLPPSAPVDVLVQHVVTVAAGGGFEKVELLEEVRETFSYASLDARTWDWVVDFAETGGGVLSAYDSYKRIGLHRGRYVGATDDLVKRHRMSIGTIVGDPLIAVKYRNGRKLGVVEESFLSKLNRNDVFVFAGRALQLVRMADMEAVVRDARKPDGPIPRWMGGRMPLSSQLADSMRALLDEIARDENQEPEVVQMQPILKLQRQWSTIPRLNELLVERTKTREGYHLFLYPFAGRKVHEGLSALIAWRMAKKSPVTFTLSYNDYGFEMLSRDEPPLRAALSDDLFSTTSLASDIESCLNASELAKRQFRAIARVAGLVFTGYPGRSKSMKQVQASTGLIFDVFQRYDPENPLMKQARREVLDVQLQEDRLRATLDRMSSSRIIVVDTPSLTPFAFPIAVDRLREHISSEKLADRVERMQIRLERTAARTVTAQSR